MKNNGYSPHQLPPIQYSQKEVDVLLERQRENLIRNATQTHQAVMDALKVMWFAVGATAAGVVWAAAHYLSK